MTKNPEFVKYASDLARIQDTIRCANEDLIKLSQRFGRMMQRLHKFDSSSILSWFSLYNRIKDAAARADSEMALLQSADLAGANPVMQSQIKCFHSQRLRLYSKLEIMDDVLDGMMEDLLENGALEEAQKQEMRQALDCTMQKSIRQPYQTPVPA